MDPKIWAELLYTYGPYALLPLLLLWVAPRQTKQFLECRREESSKQIVCAGVALACWVAAFYTGGYLVANWPPRTVYEGSLGVHDNQAKFFANEPGFFVSHTPVQGGGNDRLDWTYTVVSGAAEKEEFMFTLQWGTGVDEYTDFYVPLALLKLRKLNLYNDELNPGVLLYDDDNNLETPRKPFGEHVALPHSGPATAGGVFGIRAAHAGTALAAEGRVSETLLISWLDSPDSYWRAQGRGQLRNFTTEELQGFLARGDLTATARRQITEELARR